MCVKLLSIVILSEAKNLVFYLLDVKRFFVACGSSRMTGSMVGSYLWRLLNFQENNE